MTYEYILTETRGRVGVITLNRPDAHNALNNGMLHELMDALAAFDRDHGIGTTVITGGPRAFAAGADIKEMLSQDAAGMRASDFIQTFAGFESLTKPLIAAVSGWALGGGCELALACDLIVASETARFGQPEVTIGVIPGAGGTQRLTRLVGKPIAMEVILNNRLLSAHEALELGMVNRVASVEKYLDEAVALAHDIAGRAPLAVQAGRKMIYAALDTPLAEGLERERQAFFELFESHDRTEGMEAFVEKREPRWSGS